MASPHDGQIEYSVVRALGPCCCPDDAGERIYCGNQVYNVHGRRVDGEAPMESVQMIPAIGGPYYLTVPSGMRHRVRAAAAVGMRLFPQSPRQRPSSRCRCTCWANRSRLPRFPAMISRSSILKTGLCCSESGGDRPAAFLPSRRTGDRRTAKSSNAMILHHLDVDKELQLAFPGKSVVVSRPPKTVRVGETLRYQIEVRTKSGKPAFSSSTPGRRE